MKERGISSRTFKQLVVHWNDTVKEKKYAKKNGTREAGRGGFDNSRYGQHLLFSKRMRQISIQSITIKT